MHRMPTFKTSLADHIVLLEDLLRSCAFGDLCSGLALAVGVCLTVPVAAYHDCRLQLQSVYGGHLSYKEHREGAQYQMAPE